MEYSRDKVKKLQRRGVRIFYFSRDGENEIEEYGDEVGAVGSGGGSDSDWQSWNSGHWPKSASDVKASAGM